MLILKPLFIASSTCPVYFYYVILSYVKFPTPSHLFKLSGTAPWSHLPLTNINVVTLDFIATTTTGTDIRGGSLQ